MVLLAGIYAIISIAGYYFNLVNTARVGIDITHLHISVITTLYIGVCTLLWVCQRQGTELRRRCILANAQFVYGTALVVLGLSNLPLGITVGLLWTWSILYPSILGKVWLFLTNPCFLLVAMSTISPISTLHWYACLFVYLPAHAVSMLHPIPQENVVES